MKLSLARAEPDDKVVKTTESDMDEIDNFIVSMDNIAVPYSCSLSSGQIIKGNQS